MKNSSKGLSVFHLTLKSPSVEVVSQGALVENKLRPNVLTTAAGEMG